MGDDRYNLLAVAMHQYNITFDDAVALACLYHKHIEAHSFPTRRSSDLHKNLDQQEK